MMKTNTEQRLSLESTLAQAAHLFQDISSPHRQGIEWCKEGSTRAPISGHFEVRCKAQFETDAGAARIESMQEESEQPIEKGTVCQRSFHAQVIIDFQSGGRFKPEWISNLSMPQIGPEQISAKTTRHYLHDGTEWKILNPSQLAHIAHAHDFAGAFASMVLDMRHEQGHFSDDFVLNIAAQTKQA